RSISRLAAADRARPCFPAPSPDDAEVLDAADPTRAVLDTLRADRAGLRSREAVTQGERYPPAPMGPDREGGFMSTTLRLWQRGRRRVVPRVWIRQRRCDSSSLSACRSARS